jgi:hypothetical protein
MPQCTPTQHNKKNVLNVHSAINHPPEELKRYETKVKVKDVTSYGETDTQIKRKSAVFLVSKVQKVKRPELLQISKYSATSQSLLLPCG